MSDSVDVLYCLDFRIDIAASSFFTSPPTNNIRFQNGKMG
jgi:hypothetical protein